MTGLDSLPAEMGAAGAWEEERGSRWLRPESLDVRRMAGVLVEHGARFVTMTALPQGEGAVRVSYHWDLDGQLLTVELRSPDGRIDSISDRCPAADWIEREIHDLFAVEFQGRVLEPLLLRPGQAPGVGLGREDE
jgi:hypothetical protein